MRYAPFLSVEGEETGEAWKYPYGRFPPASAVFPAGAADTVFLRVFHEGSPICHVLCYTLAHEGCCNSPAARRVPKAQTPSANSLTERHSERKKILSLEL